MKAFALNQKKVVGFWVALHETFPTLLVHAAHDTVYDVHPFSCLHCHKLHQLLHHPFHMGQMKRDCLHNLKTTKNAKKLCICFSKVQLQYLSHNVISQAKPKTAT